MKKIAIFILVFICLVLIGALVFKTGKKPAEKGGERQMEISQKKVLMVLAPKDFRDEEYLEPRKILEEAGAIVTVASKGVEEAQGKLGAKVAIDKDLSEINVDEYDAVIFVGGPGASVYFADQQALALAGAAYEAGRVVGAICIAPSILANAGILSGKLATSFPSEAENLKTKGANYTGELVTVDSKIVTARGPEAAEEFGKKLVEALKG